MTADDEVGEAPAHQRLFDDSRLRVDAIEHHHIGGAELVGLGQRRDLACDVVSLVALGHRGEVGDLLATLVLGPQRFLLALAIVPNHGARGGEDGFGRAVILLELEDLRVGKIVFEIEDVADVGAAPFVDRLILVADHADISGSCRERLHQQVLHAIGVLVLIDHQMRGAPLILFECRGIIAQQLVGQQLQVAEVHRIDSAQTFAIEPVEVRDRGVASGLGARGKLGRRDRLVLGLLDAGARQLGRGRICQCGRLDDVADDRHRIAFIEDGKILLVANRARLGAQNPRARRMKRADPRRLRTIDQRGDALTHLTGGLVGEGDREHLARVGVALAEQVGDTIGDRASLAGTGAGQDEDRAVGREDRGALLRI